jgi:hypothetical protein
VSSTALLQAVAGGGLALDDVPGDDARYTFTVSRLHARAAHGATYSAAVRASAAARRAAAAPPPPPPFDAVSLGLADGKRALATGGGKLLAPDLSAEPLWLTRAVDVNGGGATVRHREVARALLAGGKLVPRKFKPAPTTHPERIDCARALSPGELAALALGPPCVALGDVFFGVPASRSFGVFNGLAAPVLVALSVADAAAEALSRTGPPSQVVPPGARAGFDVTYFDGAARVFREGARAFEGEVRYVVNGLHGGAFRVTAVPRPITLSAQKSELSLGFGEDNLAPYVSATLRVTNAHPFPVAYRWYSREGGGSRGGSRPGSRASSRPSSARAPGEGGGASAGGGGGGGSTASSASFSVVSAGGGSGGANPFEVLPPSGAVPAGGSETFLFTYRPTPGGGHGAEFCCAVEGGWAPFSPHALSLRLRGERCEPAISPAERSVDFGRFGVGLRRVVTLTLRNTGATGGAWYAQPDSVPPAAALEPAQGYLRAGESVDVRLTLAPSEPLLLDPNFCALAFTVRGGRGFVVPLAAVVVMPVVDIVGDLAFGGVVLGAAARRRITLANRSEFHTEIAVDFRALAPFWRVKPPRPTGEDDDAMSVGDRSIIRYDFDGLENVPDFGDIGGGGGGGARGRLPAGVTAVEGGDSAAEEPPLDSDDDDEEEEEEEEDDENDEGGGDGVVRALPPRFIAVLNPGATLMFDLVFRPSVARGDGPSGEWDFLLPVALVTALGLELPGLRRRVTGHGVAPRLKADACYHDWGTVHFAEEPVRRVPLPRSLRLFNTCPEGRPVAWRADTSNLRGYFPGVGPCANFSVEPTHGVIAPGRSQRVTLFFSPAAPGKQFFNTVPLWLCEEDSEEAFSGGSEGPSPPSSSAPPYLELELTGRAVPAQLHFDRREVILPAVPLGVTAQAVFYVLNCGFDHLALTVRIPANEITASVGVPLSVAFPGGSTLSLATPRLPVVVEFNSPTTPLAFTVTVEFHDEATGQKWGMPVTGSADNCLLSNYDYLDAARGARLLLEAPPGGAPNLVAAEDAREAGATGEGGGRVAAPSPARSRSGMSADGVEPAWAADGGAVEGGGVAGFGLGRHFHGVSAGAPPPSRDASARTIIATLPPPAKAALTPHVPRGGGGGAAGGAAVKAPLDMGAKTLSAAERARRARAQLAPRSALAAELPVVLAADTDVATALGRAAVPGELTAGVAAAGGGAAGAVDAASLRAAARVRRRAPWALPLPHPRALAAALAAFRAENAPLVSFLNACGLLAEPLDAATWPEGVVAAHGGPIFDFVELASGTPVAGRLSGAALARLPASRRARTQALHRAAGDLLHHLKAQGGHVHGVRPECLLALPEFLLVRKYLPRGVLFGGAHYAAPQLPQGAGAAAKKAAAERLAAAFPLLSAHAWAVVATQAVKLYALGRATLRTLATGTPGMLLDARNGALWRALEGAAEALAGEVKAARDAVTAAARGGGGGDAARPAAEAAAAAAAAGSARALISSGASVAGSLRSERAPRSRRAHPPPAFVDPESTEGLLREGRGPHRVGGGAEPSVVLEGNSGGGGGGGGGGGAVERDAAGGGSSRGSYAGGDGGSVATGTVVGGGRGGGAATVLTTATAALKQLAAGAGPSGRVSLGGGRWVDSLTAKAVDPLLLARVGVVDEKVAAFFAPESALTGSNLYSAPELTLLRWAGWHYGRMWAAMGGSAGAGGRDPAAAPRRRLVDFERDFADGSVLIHLLLSHAPELGKPRRALDVSGGGVHISGERLPAAAARANARAIMAALGELQLRPPFTAEALCPQAFSGAWEGGECGSAGGGWEGGGAAAAPAADPLGSLTELIQTYTAGGAGAPAAAAKEGDAEKGKGGARARAGAAGGGGAQPSLTTAALAAKDGPLVLPVTPLFDDSHGRVAGAVPGTDRVIVRAGGGRGMLALGAGGAPRGGGGLPAAPRPPPPLLPAPGEAASGGGGAGLAPPRDLLYALLWLFSALPAYVPRALVDFKGPLGLPTTRYIALSNPTRRVVTYRVLLEADAENGSCGVRPDVGCRALPGADPFGGPDGRARVHAAATHGGAAHAPERLAKPALPPVWSSPALEGGGGDTFISLPPGGSRRFPVTATPRFSAPAHAKLSFIGVNARGATLAPSVLTFALRAVVTSRPPLAVLSAAAPTFASAELELDVRSPFAHGAGFAVSLVPMEAAAARGDNVPKAALERLLAAAPRPPQPGGGAVAWTSEGPPTATSVSEFVVTGWRPPGAGEVAAINRAAAEAAAAVAPPPPPQPPAASKSLSERAAARTAALLPPPKGAPLPGDAARELLRVPEYLQPHFSWARRDALRYAEEARAQAEEEARVMAAVRAANGGIDPDPPSDEEEAAGGAKKEDEGGAQPLPAGRHFHGLSGAAAAIIAARHSLPPPPPPPGAPSALTPEDALAVGRAKLPGSGKPAPPPPFWTRYGSVFLPGAGGGGKVLPVQFSPFSPGTHRVAVVLRDPAHAIAELVYEIDALAEPPEPHAMCGGGGEGGMAAAVAAAARAAGGGGGGGAPPASHAPHTVIHTRARPMKEIVKCLRIPPVNAERENAWDALLARLPRAEARAEEVASREGDRRAEAEARAAALRALRRSARVEDPLLAAAAADASAPASLMWGASALPGVGIGPGGAMLPSFSASTVAGGGGGGGGASASLGAGRSAIAAARAKGVLPGASKLAAVLVLGTFYSVSIDSPFFSAPPTVYVPAPLNALPAVGVGAPRGGAQGGVGEEPSAASGGGYGAEGSLLFGGASPATLLDAALGEVPGAPEAGPLSIAAMPASQAAAARGRGKEGVFKMLTAPLEVAAALASGAPEALKGLAALPLTLTPSGPGEYHARVTLSSERDVRVYAVCVTVDGGGPAKAVELRAPLGGVVAQPLPVGNHPPAGPRAAPPLPWTLRPVLTPTGRTAASHGFSVTPALLHVKPGETSAELCVSWRPGAEGDETATLSLEPVTNAKLGGRLAMPHGTEHLVPVLAYELHGVGEPPLAAGGSRLSAALRGGPPAEDTLLLPFPIGVPCPSPHTLNFRVTATLPGAVAPPFVTVAPGGTAIPVPLAWRPAAAAGAAPYASQHGALTATDTRSGRYVWWRLEGACAGLEAAGHLALATAVRAPLVVEAELENPSATEALQLAVTLAGEGLSGPPTVSIPPGGRRAYTFFYAPHFPTTAGGGDGGGGAEPAAAAAAARGYLTFTPSAGEEEGGGGGGRRVGAELIYTLDLTASPAPPVALPPLSAPLGGAAGTSVVVENTSPFPAALRAWVGGGAPPGVWAVDVTRAALVSTLSAGVTAADEGAAGVEGWAPPAAPGEGLVVPPFAAVAIPVAYRPSALAPPGGGGAAPSQAAVLRVESPTLGEWVFLLSGGGTPPQPAPLRAYAAPLGARATCAVDFVNPFAAPLPISAVELLGGAPGVLTLLCVFCPPPLRPP